MTDNAFFNESQEQSRVKAAIVSEYFWAWAKIIIPTAKKSSGEIAYIDLFAGPGRYVDGTKSTPLLILEKAVADPVMRDMLITIFNDMDKKNVESLSTAISSLPEIDKMRHEPIIFNHEVGEQIVGLFRHYHDVPTLFFVDPWGYKGLSLNLINSVLQNWGCDCIFFFNYNRIKMGLSNHVVEQHMNSLFGEKRANELRNKLKSISQSQSEQELTIVNEIAQALRDLGGKYVLPFRFRGNQGNRTSHHLIFVSKHFRGYDVMKDIMFRHSTMRDQGVALFEYNSASQNQPMLENFTLRPIETLKESLLMTFSGQVLSMKDVYEKHSVDTPYLMKNYRDALRQLEAENRVKTDPPASSRRKLKGEVTFSESVQIQFPIHS